MAATLTRDGELTTFSFPIEKTETDADGNVIVYGKASDGSLDSDSQIIDPDFAAKAIREWLNDGANVRVQHNPQRDPAGVGIDMDTDEDGGTWVKSKIIEPVAQKLVLGGALRAYSVGIARPQIVRDAAARGGRIKGGQVVEISLVDRPANKNCGVQIVKAKKNGRPKITGELQGDMEFISKAIGGDLLVKVGAEGYEHGWKYIGAGDDVSKGDVVRPEGTMHVAYHNGARVGSVYNTGNGKWASNVKSDFTRNSSHDSKDAAVAHVYQHAGVDHSPTGQMSPAQRTRYQQGFNDSGHLTGTNDPVQKGAGVTTPVAEKTVTLELPEDVSVAFSPADLARVIAKRKSPDVGEDTHPGGVDRDSLPDDDFAGKNRSFPITSPGDVSDAAQSLGRAGDDNYDTETIKSNIKRIAHRKGQEYVDQLPDSWKAENAEVLKQEAREYLIVKYGWLPSQLEALTDDSLLDLLEATKSAEADLMKSACTLCHGTGKIRDGHVTCPRCHGSGSMPGTDDDDDDDDASDDDSVEKRSKAGEPFTSGTEDENDTGDDPGSENDDDDDDAQNGNDSADDDDDGEHSRVSEKARKGGKRCKTCGGSGRILDGHRDCPDCGGSGARVKKSARADVQKDWGSWDAAHQTLQQEHTGGRPDAAQLANAHAVHEEHLAHMAHLAHQAHEAHLAHMSHMEHIAQPVHTASALATSPVKVTTPAPSGQVAELPVGNGMSQSTARMMEKSMKTACKCGGMMKAKHSFCPKCGAAAAGAGEMPEKTGAKKSANVMITKGDVPGEGVPGHEGTTAPMPDHHREPDGAMNEAFEDDADMQDGDENSPQEQPTKLEKPMLKGLNGDVAVGRIISKGIPVDMGVLHDLTCPAFSRKALLKCYPGRTVSSVVNEGWWQQKSLDLAATLPFPQAAHAAQLGAAAVVLKNSPDEWVQEVGKELHKAFSDANPGPGAAPTPVSMTPAAYNRPYLSAGHSAPSPQQGPPNSTPLVSGQISADMFNRPPLIAGHEAPSPANAPLLSAAVGQAIDAAVTVNGIIASAQAANGSSLASAIPGRPPVASLPASFPGVTKNRTFYSNSTKEQTRAAMQAIHDHVARTFPDLCPMAHEGAEPAEKSVTVNPMDGYRAPRALTKSVQAPERVVISASPGDGVSWTGNPGAAGTNTTYNAGYTMSEQPNATELAVTAVKQKSEAKELKKRLKIAKLEKMLAQEAAFAAQLMPQELTVVKGEVISSRDEETAREIAELRGLVKSQSKMLKKQAKSLDEIASAPDHTAAAFRGILPGLPPLVQKQASRAPVEPGTMADVAERTQAMMLRELEHEFRTSPDPGLREAAWRSILTLRGVG